MYVGQFYWSVSLEEAAGYRCTPAGLKRAFLLRWLKREQSTRTFFEWRVQPSSALPALPLCKIFNNISSSSWRDAWGGFQRAQDNRAPTRPRLSGADEFLNWIKMHQINSFVGDKTLYLSARSLINYQLLSFVCWLQDVLKRGRRLERLQLLLILLIRAILQVWGRRSNTEVDLQHKLHQAVHLNN